MWNLLLAIQEHAEEAAHAAADGHAEVMAPGNWLPGVTALVVFGIAFGVLAKVVWPKILAGLDEREQKILNEIKSAEEARKQANSALAEYEKELANAREEASRMISSAKSEAKATADELRSRNEIELTEMKARATKDITSAKEAAITEIHAEAAMLATAVASRILQREISVEDQQRLVEESLSQLSSMKN